MSSTRSVTVNFFHIQPGNGDDPSYERLMTLFNSLDPLTLRDRPKKLDYELCSHVVERRDGFVTGALSNGQTGGLLPYLHNQQGDMLPVLGPGQKLIHPTCFFYDIKRSILLLESITRGATEADWCLYFQNNLSSPAIHGQVVRKGDIEDIVQNLRYITQLHVEIAGYRRNDLFTPLAKSRSLKEFTALAENSKSNVVNCTLRTDVKPKTKKHGRKDQESLEPGFVRQAIDTLLGEPEVKVLTVAGINDSDDYVPIINLLDFRLKETIQVDISELAMANLNLKKRVERLREVHQKHLSSLLPYEKI